MMAFKRVVWLSWVLIVTLSLLYGCALQQAGMGGRLNLAPTIQFDDTIYDFKFAAPEQEIVHIFTFKNLGSKSVAIKEISTDCGCTATLTADQSIPPGGEGQIHVEFYAPKFEGPQEKHIRISTNPPTSEEIVLAVKGVVKRGVALFPQGFGFGKINAGETRKTCIRLYQLSKEKLELIKIEADRSRFNVAFSPFTSINHKGFDICLELKPGAPHGVMNDVITLYTNLSTRPRIDAMVLALVE